MGSGEGRVYAILCVFMDCQNDRGPLSASDPLPEFSTDCGLTLKHPQSPRDPYSHRVSCVVFYAKLPHAKASSMLVLKVRVYFPFFLFAPGFPFIQAPDADRSSFEAQRGHYLRTP